MVQSNNMTNMKVLVTGANGFIGKNLSIWLKRSDIDVLAIDIDNLSKLDEYALQADFIVHLAGINRPMDVKEFYDGNLNSIVRLVDILKNNKKKTPILLSSSTQAEYDNDYGKSKKMGEDFLFDYQNKTGNPVYIYRFQNVFGKWCRPNYNSVVATFCHNIANGLDISVNDPNIVKEFVYIDDICKTILDLIKSEDYKGSNKILTIKPSYLLSIGELANIIKSFKESRDNLIVPNMDNGIVSKLYATYLSYLPTNQFIYDLNMHVDNRGSFTEFIKTLNSGQVSVNVGKPGVVKGNHFHHTKNEKFLVVKGTCSIKFRKIDSEDVIEYIVSGDKLQVVDIPTGYTHSITNIGQDDSITIMWASESFDPNNPDTYFEEVVISGK